MMNLKKASVIRTALLSCTCLCAVASVGLFVASYNMSTLNAWLIPQSREKNQDWVSIREDDIRVGATVPSNTNVMIYLPEEITRITRKTLFGRRGINIRYWGFCFPQTQQEAESLRRRGLPGTIFLSEKEREVREAQYLEKVKSSLTIYDDRDKKSIERRVRESYGSIRHQQEIFVGGTVCYVMTEDPLPIGTDEDKDAANIKIENIYGSDPKNADTDADGILDGLEIFHLGTHPNRRDSDGDGLIDGIEDKNRNGRIDPGEPDPTQWDTDGDGLCDGLCKVNNGKQILGEDKNLNGELDENETDPTLVDTDGDGILDEQEYYNCLLEGGEDC